VVAARPFAACAMMRVWLLACLFSVVLSGTAISGPVEDGVVRQLRQQGFSQIEVSRTWLGRSRIVSRRGDLFREIILNPLTGEILRDYWRTWHEREGPTLFNPPSGEGGEGAFDDDGDDDDGDGDDGDDGDDDDGEDRGDDGDDRDNDRDNDDGNDNSGGDGDGGDDD